MHASQSPDKTAIAFEGEQITYKELWERVRAASKFFAYNLGSESQKVIALLATNSIDFVVCHLAIVHAGHITLPLDPAFKRLEIDAIISRLRPAMLVAQDRYDDKFSRHDDVEIVKVNEVLEAGSSDFEGDLLRLDPTKQVATITFTSGTSGQPKGVPNTHANHAWNIYTCSKVWDWDGSDSLLITLPLSHMHGLVISLSGCVYHGNTMYLHQQSFDTAAVLEELSSGRISMFTHGPIAYTRLLEAEGQFDITSVRLFISGSAPLPPALWRQFKKRYGVEIIETYGTSETGRIAGNQPGHVKLGSPGKVMPGVDVKVSADGEVAVRSGGVFPGYWNNREATNASMASGGYWRTGDIGELKDGYLFLKGRLQERIRKFGYTVSPRDVEWALLENPSIKEAYVMGRQLNDNADDELFFFIAGDVTENEIRDFCKTNLPFSWRPDHVILLDKLPRTKTGKPHLKRLQEMAKT